MLLRKSLRSLRSKLGQCVALAAVVAGGIAVYYGANTAITGLIAARNASYLESNFADYYFDLKSAPAGAISSLRALPGVLEVTRRVYMNVKIVRNGAARDAGRLIGCDGDAKINRVTVREGRRFVPGAQEPEVMIDHQYAVAHSLRPGDSLEIIAKGRSCRLRISGIATSPEFLHKKKSSLEFPGWGGLGIIITDMKTAQGMFGSSEDVNQFLVRYSAGADRAAINKMIQGILHQYGIIHHYPQEDHQSHRYIENQVVTISIASALIPPGIFIASLLMQSILLRRMIREERRQIGILKAIGHNTRSIIVHYSIIPLIVGLLGSLAGLFGGVCLARILSTLLERAIDLPVAGWGVNSEILIKTFFIGMTAPLSAGVIAAMEIARIDPVAAFRVEIPHISHSASSRSATPLWKMLPSSWKMSLRSISRNPGRFSSLTLGIILCIGMILVTLRFSDSRSTMLYRHFVEENRYDYHVKFYGPRPEMSISDWKNWPEIIRLESSLEIPVKLFRADSADSNRNARNEIIAALQPGGTLTRLYDQNRLPMAVPLSGIVLSPAAARILNLSTGDRVIIETREALGIQKRSTLLVKGVSGQDISGHSIVSLDQGARILGERHAINSVLIRSSAENFLALEERLVAIPEIASILNQQEQYNNASQLTEAITWFSSLMAVFAFVIGASIVYKNSMMSYIERKREIATLLTLGWNRREIGIMLLDEVILAFVLGVIIAVPLAVKIGTLYLKAISSEQFSWPTVLYTSTGLTAIIATALFAFAGHYLAVRRVKNLNLLETVTSRE